jgi:hypothetical protein
MYVEGVRERGAVLKKVFGPKWDEFTGDWIKLYNEELHEFYTLASILEVTKSRKTRGLGHV